MTSLSPAIKAVLILDSEGTRIAAKYFSADFSTPAAQTFESQLFAKTRNTVARAEADIIMLANIISVLRTGADTFFYVVGDANENELILAAVLDGLYGAISTMLQGRMERRELLDNLELVLLAVDELVDGGVILETDPASITNRVLMRGVDGGAQGEAAGGEASLAAAFATARTQFTRSFLQG